MRYVPREGVEDLQTAIDGYARFTELVQQYADEMIRLTRREHARGLPKRPRRATASSLPQKRSPRNQAD